MQIVCAETAVGVGGLEMMGRSMDTRICEYCDDRVDTGEHGTLGLQR